MRGIGKKVLSRLLQQDVCICLIGGLRDSITMLEDRKMQGVLQLGSQGLHFRSLCLLHGLRNLCSSNGGMHRVVSVQFRLSKTFCSRAKWNILGCRRLSTMVGMSFRVDEYIFTIIAHTGICASLIMHVGEHERQLTLARIDTNIFMIAMSLTRKNIDKEGLLNLQSLHSMTQLTWKIHKDSTHCWTCLQYSTSFGTATE